jgi:hypothetical protein
MNNFRMTQRKKPPQPPNQSRATDSAFDVWLNRGLHELFDDVAKEPIPDELLKLLKPEDPAK